MSPSAFRDVGAVLFDLDGTLLDTLADLADTVNAVLAARGHPTHGHDDYRRFVGEGVGLLMRRALPEAERTPEGIAAGVEAFRREYARRWHSKTRPYPGVDVLLDGLFARGLHVGILSNKPDDFTRQTTAALLPGWRFDLVWGEGADVPRKPDPRGALRAAQAMGVRPGHCLFCGDTATDMATAVAAGMVPVGALWGFRDEAELRAAGARAVIARPPDLLDLLGG